MVFFFFNQPFWHRVRRGNQGDQGGSPLGKKKLRMIRVSATYMPTRLSCPNSEFVQELKGITESFRESHATPYVPGVPAFFL